MFGELINIDANIDGQIKMTFYLEEQHTGKMLTTEERDLKKKVKVAA